MAVTAFWFGLALKNQYDNTAVVNWGTGSGGDTIKVSLHTSTQSIGTTQQDTLDFFNDLTAEITTSGDYAAGGATLTGKSVTYTTGTNTVALDAADVTWTGVTFTARYAVIYKSTGTSSTSPLLGYVDFGADQTVNSGNFTITWAADGVLKLVAA